MNMRYGTTSREQWLEAGLRLLGTKGRAALTIDRLCKSQRRTKGSFYHHFKSMAAYVDALMTWWEATAVQLDAPTAASASRQQRLETELRAWGQLDTRVLDGVNRVDRSRMERLAEKFVSQGLPKSRAMLVARLEYAAFVGGLTLFGDREDSLRTALARLLDDAIESLHA